MLRFGDTTALNRWTECADRLQRAPALPDDPADIDLLAQIARRNETALATLYQRYSRLVFILALRIVGDPALAEEVMQDTFLRCWNRVETYHARAGRVPSWLVGIARNRAIDMVRSRQYRARLHEQGNALTDQMPDATQRSMAEIGELAELRRCVAAALAELPPTQRRVMELACYRGLTQNEIAQEVGAPLGTIKTRTRAALHRLRTLLRPLNSDYLDGCEA